MIDGISDDHEGYNHRLKLFAQCIVQIECKDQRRAEIERERQQNGDINAEDLKKYVTYYWERRNYMR